ncbi:unnamed protein product [Adineta steineri]|uniref:G-protein coupled receptors family 1 profile domain-containing protein n=1 Tax=Adineta steineri TaxID=433720 RepID=A0A814EUX5_9BILA|nr:unnamed protein product [Adineta steineri]CAF4074442.1 unnamed protein product [Adineta steineri]
MTITILPFIQQGITRYGITICLILGPLGNIFNCMVFTRSSHRNIPSSVYFLSLSVFGIIHSIWSFTPILYALYHPDPQNYSIFYCKIRLYGSHTLGLCLRYVIMLACVDRFLVTRTNVRIRSLSSVNMARKLVFIMFVLCSLIAIQILVTEDIKNGICTMLTTYKLPYSIYQIIVISIIPPMLMCIFSILTIRKLHQRRDIIQMHVKRKDRYLMRMVIAEVMINVLTSIPYSANLLYGALTYYVVNKSALRLEIESFISYIAQFIIYFLGIAPFYLFMLASKPFRKEFINLFINFWNKYIIRLTRIVPLYDPNISRINNGRAINHDRQQKATLNQEKNTTSIV